MESRVSSNCTRNIDRPSPPEKEVNRKENTVGKIAKKATDSEVHACSDTGHGEFDCITLFFATKKIGIFRVRFYRFSSSETS